MGGIAEEPLTGAADHGGLQIIGVRFRTDACREPR